ncbi:hypothetical protein B0A49_01457 [Cryomyces minteri]|uniref:Uncharacterized protein n=1 Tax=Cryomyces minteri TaxID=331657 RepID=A0A4U0XT08_9PEZI|nr:hypothetical protein B0A49_01457 [Cryomyces minteri]
MALNWLPPALPISYSGGSLTLDTSTPVLTLDYGADVAGFPFVEVALLTGSAAQIELKYSEPFDGLGMTFSDGPWLFTNGLVNSFRTETFNISQAGRTESFFLQGGQRWQTITLLTNTSVTIKSAGFRPSVDIKPASSLPGAFSASIEDYTGFWDLGPRALQAACVEKNSQPSTWEVTSHGALIRGQYTAQSAKGITFGNYTMASSTKIVSGGTGWRVAIGANGGYGPYFLVTTGGPQLFNLTQNLVPVDTLTYGFGFTIINQTILPSAPIRHFPLPVTLSENEWYRVTTTINSTGYNIEINGMQIAVVPSAEDKQYLNPCLVCWVGQINATFFPHIEELLQ